MAESHGADDIIRLPHEFEMEITHLVTQNHALTLDGILQLEEGVVADLSKALEGDDPEILQSQVRHAKTWFDELRRAANHQALVSFVTRLEHWTRKLVKRHSLSTNKARPPVTRDMEALNSLLGIAPIPVGFFEDLVTARDSVIHADSQAQWEYQGKIRCIADRYTHDGGELGFTDEHLTEAIERAITQVKWYDERGTEVSDSSKRPA